MFLRDGIHLNCMSANPLGILNKNALRSKNGTWRYCNAVIVIIFCMTSGSKILKSCMLSFLHVMQEGVHIWHNDSVQMTTRVSV